MPTKTPVKKTKKPSKKTVKKTPKKLTLDDLLKAQEEAWKAIRETQQAHKETEKAIKETQKNIFGLDNAKEEAWAAIRETQKNIGGLNNTLGSLVEHILTPNLPQKFKKLGYSFNRIATYKFAEGVYAQIDGMLENGTQAVAVEVKTTLRQMDIDEHLIRMEKIRKYADEHGDKRQFMGAMAATITDETTKNYALKKGLFVIEPSGEDVKVTKPETEPRVW
jgi:hypothetical protein